jgi:hypothetical protein
MEGGGVMMEEGVPVGSGSVLRNGCQGRALSVRVEQKHMHMMAVTRDRCFIVWMVMGKVESS